MYWLLLGLVGVSMGVAAYQLLLLVRHAWAVQLERKRMIEMALGVVGTEAAERRENRWLRGAFWQEVRKQYERLCHRAQHTVDLPFRIFLRNCLLLGLLVGGTVAFFWDSWGAVALSGIAAAATPGLRLWRRAEERKRAIVRALPGFMDLLVLSVESGLDFTSALRRIIERGQPSALNTEMRLLIMEIRLGSTRRAALRDMAQRLRIAEIGSLAGALAQADLYGAPLGRALRVQAEQLRERRFQQAEERAGKAAVLVSLPTVLFLVPCVFLILVGPYIPEIMSALSTGF
jgi:pilus assembly protein TadC